jgi:Domain of unknown function (DUF1906)
MKVIGSVQKAIAGAVGFDVNQPLTAVSAKAFKDAGYTFCVRYVPRNASLVAGNLTTAEAAIILNAGLSLMAVQHVALPGWNPSAGLGTSYGAYAAQYLSKIVGLPPGFNLWCDLEEVATTTTTDDVIAYCKAWYAAVYAAGYVPGLYVGYGVKLTTDQLYSELPFKHYWNAYNGDGVATRGCQILQKTQQALGGIRFDPNVAQNDHMGDSAFWLSPAL